MWAQRSPRKQSQDSAQTQWIKWFRHLSDFACQILWLSSSIGLNTWERLGRQKRNWFWTGKRNCNYLEKPEFMLARCPQPDWLYFYKDTWLYVWVDLIHDLCVSPRIPRLAHLGIHKTRKLRLSKWTGPNLDRSRIGGLETCRPKCGSLALVRRQTSGTLYRTRF